MAGLAAPVQARPIQPAEQRYSPLTGVLPFCDDPSTLSYIASRFASREQGYWNSSLAILTYERVHEIGYRTPGADFVPRRYCEARAAFNDLKLRHVVYWIGEDLGFAGYGDAVRWCVVGLDRNHADDFACRAVRP